MNISKLSSMALVACVTFFLTGCHITLTNLTPKEIPQNPSGIYTLSVSTEVTNGQVDKDTVEAFAIVDGEKFAMVQSDVAPNIFQFDYALPKDRDTARYYYEVNYALEDGSGKIRTEIGELSEFSLPTVML